MRFATGASPGDYYDRCAKEADEAREKIAKVKAELAVATVTERDAQILRKLLRQLESELQMALYTGD